MMQQSILLTATRAPDGLRKTHPVKTLCRYLRRCYLLSAFDNCILEDPYDPRGGSFMGPCRSPEVRDLPHVADLYIECGDEHFRRDYSGAWRVRAVVPASSRGLP